jgi:MFS family permease
MAADRRRGEHLASVSRYAGVLGERNFRVLYIGRAVSITGDKIAPIALAFAVLALTDSPADLGFVLSARVIVMVVLLLVGGVWSDRLPRRAVLVGTDLLRFATQGATAVLLLAGWATIWQLVVLQALAGGGQAFFRPASTGLIPSIVAKPRLQQANALLGVSEQATNVLGPVIAGAIVATTGSGWAIGLDAGSYAVSAAFLLGLRVDESARERPARSFIADLSEGWQAFRSRAWLVALVAEYALYHFAVFAPFYVLGPTVAARELGGAGAWATILAVYGIGAIFGGIAGLRLRPARPLVVVSALFLLDAPPLVALALSESVALIAAAALLAGAASGYGAAVWETTLQELVPAEALSRVSSYDWLGSMAFLPLGYAAVGPAAEWLGVATGLLIGSALQVASVPALLATHSIHAIGSNRGLRPPSITGA